MGLCPCRNIAEPVPVNCWWAVVLVPLALERTQTAQRQETVRRTFGSGCGCVARGGAGARGGPSGGARASPSETHPRQAVKYSDVV